MITCSAWDVPGWSLDAERPVAALSLRTPLALSRLGTGAKLVFGESLVFPAGDLALIHTPWTMQLPDGSSPEGATAEVVRRQPDGSWKYVIDNPDGTALLHHE